jgi:GMP synthase-like glutamine amidotransferase
MKFIRINQFHQDHVSILSKRFKILALTKSSTPNHVVIFENVQCIFIQGHPKVCKDTIKKMNTIKRGNGALNKVLENQCLNILDSAPPKWKMFR